MRVRGAGEGGWRTPLKKVSDGEERKMSKGINEQEA